MQTLLMLFAIQGVFGAFDTLYHHELKERLPWRRTAATELKLHGIRNFIYSILFLSLGWLAWDGIFAWCFAYLLLVEVFITLWDFVVEDHTRKLPSTERVTHTILAINYGVILALLAPELWQWSMRPTGFTAMNWGILSWIMTLYAAGVFIWGWRDWLRGNKWARTPAKPKTLAAHSTQRRRILVTGGTGFIGKPLCQTLIDQGNDVTILTRSLEKASLFRGRITLIETLDSLRGEDTFDAIINLAGEPISQRWSKAARACMLESRLQTTEAIVRYVQRATQKPSVFISSSAIGYYGTDAHTSFQEDTAPSQDLTGKFPRDICLQWETIAAKVAAQGVRTCLLRTGVVLESDGGALAQMLFPFEFCLGGPIGNGRQWFSWIHREDLIRLILHLMNTPALQGPFNATAPEPVTSKGFASALGKALRRPAFLPLPAFQVKLLFGDMGKTLLLAGQKVVPQKALASGFRFRHPTIKEALEDILT